MPLPDTVQQLVDNFAANRTEYHKGHYNETQTRVDYVNPLFAALGWDMDNGEGLSELHRNVIHEDMVKIGGHSKAPDYSFRAGGERKFFVETKKPSVNLYPSSLRGISLATGWDPFSRATSCPARTNSGRRTAASSNVT